MSGSDSSIADKLPRRPQYQPLVIVLAAAAAGIAIDRFWPQGVAVWMILAASAMPVWWWLWRQGWNGFSSMVLLGAVAAIGGAWHHCQWNCYPADDLGNFTSDKLEPVCLEAVAQRSPRETSPPSHGDVPSLRREASFRLEIIAVAIRDRDVWKPISGRANLRVQGESPKVQAGDRLRIFGKISAPTVAHNPGEFDYAAYLRANRIRTEIQSKSAACVLLLEPGSSWNLSRWLDRLRIRSSEVFRRYLDPNQADLASAVLLGEREHIELDQTEAYMASGTIHVLSISGLHVSVLAGSLIWLMRLVPLPRFFGAAGVGIVTMLYALMVDVNPPVVRATILVLIACGSLWYYRGKLGFNSLAAAGLVVLAINPCDLFHIGAQLSFLSVAVLIWFGARWLEREEEESDPLKELVARNSSFLIKIIIRGKSSVVELMLFGFAIWLVTTPLVMARFHLFSPVGLVMNTLLWIPMTLGLLSGFLVLACGFFCPLLADCCGIACNANLWVLDKSVRWAESTPGTHFWVSGPSDWWLAVLYGGLALVVGFPMIRPSKRWCAAIAAGWIPVGFWASFAGHDAGALRCTFVSVGHGLATVVELPAGQTLLYDAGQMSAPHHAAKNIAGYLWSRGITHLDAVVLSHADIDHYNALPDLLKKFSVDVVYVPPLMFDEHSQNMKHLRAALDGHKTPCKELYAGERLPGAKDCRIEVLHPPRGGIPASSNANSLVLSIDYRGHRILLPGDLEPPGMNDLLTEEPHSCTVLQSPHHGSRKNNSAALAAWCKPKWVVLSGDGRANTAETDSIYRAVGGQTLHTHRDGAITFTFEGKEMKIERFLKAK